MIIQQTYGQLLFQIEFFRNQNVFLSTKTLFGLSLQTHSILKEDSISH